MPETPITKFDIVRELLDIATSLRGHSYPQIDLPGITGRIEQLRARIIATTPEQLDAPRGGRNSTRAVLLPPFAIAPDVRCFVQPWYGGIRMTMFAGKHGGGADYDADMFDPATPHNEAVWLSNVKGTLLDLQRCVEPSPTTFTTTEAHPGTTAPAAPADGAQHGDDPDHPSDVEPAARAGAQPVGRVQPAASVDPASCMRSLALILRAPGALKVDCAELEALTAQGRWSDVRSALADIVAEATSLASQATGLLADLAGVEDDADAGDDVPF